ncbi:uncharacterized protein LOC130441389 [Diorhabda sublineata]|uniref:uncharacterized protein LOC130441389 n=1 Tax=Diorhabda sublineata TaxID=1163346 RepID=UPI0024E194AB|nr:uncharacterized protein LOC130441389 [Diorhabda sublineata]
MSENSLNVNIEEALKTILIADTFEDINVEIEESLETNQALVKVTASKQGVSEDLKLVANIGKSENVLEAFKREAYILKNVIPLFLDLQKYLKIQNPLTTFPKCFNYLDKDGIVILLLENLEKAGYTKIEGDLNEHNYKLVLKTIAKFHGLSLGLRHLHRNKFDELLGNCRMISKNMFEELAQFFTSRVGKLKFNLKLRMRLDLLKKFDRALENFSGNKISEILNETVEKSVLVHGNFHHNSVLLKLQGENATDVALEGFQTSGLHSPIIDLSHYYFSGIGNDYFSGVTDFLKFYHEELSSFLKTLGCNAEEIFSVNTLLDHWQRYSFYGFCFAIASLELGSLKLDDVLTEFKKGEERGEAVQKAPREPRSENIIAYRKKLEKIVEGFLESEIRF